MIKKLLLILFFVALFLSPFLLLTAEKANAAASWGSSCTLIDPPPVTTSSGPVTLKIGTGENAAGGTKYDVVEKHPGDANWYSRDDIEANSASELVLENFTPQGGSFREGDQFFNVVEQGQPRFESNFLCNSFSLHVAPASPNTSDHCQISLSPESITPQTDLVLKVNFIDAATRGTDSTTHHIRIINRETGAFYECFDGGGSRCPAPTTTQLEAGFSFGPYYHFSTAKDKGYSVEVTATDCKGLPFCDEGNYCSWSFTVNNADEGGGRAAGQCKYCPIGTWQGGENESISCIRDNTLVTPYTCDLTSDKPYCDPVYGCAKGPLSLGNAENTRILCAEGVETSSGTCEKIPSAIGDLPTNIAGFTSALLGIILSIIGGVALILIIISGYRIMSSQGNPEGLQHAREQLTAAIVGLLFVIFSLVVLEVIGVDILQLPGLTR